MLTLEKSLDPSASEQNLITFSDYMQRMLYGRHGYYTAGIVKFCNDFETNATRGVALAMLLCEHIHLLYRKEIETGIRRSSEPSPFLVLELSGGNGQLAYKVLSFLKELGTAKMDLYPLIWRDIQYKVYEISPDLAEKQRVLCRSFSEKFTVLNASALDISTEHNVALCFSNELWDSLPVDLITKTESGDCNIAICLPTVSAELFAKMTSTYSRVAPPKGFAIEESLIPGLSISLKEQVVLSRAAIDSIANKMETSNWIKFLSKIKWVKTTTALEYFPELKALLSASGYLVDLDKNIEVQVSAQAVKLIEAIKECDPRAQIHWDYGTLHRGGVRDSIRSFGKDGRTLFDLNSKSVDITVSVDWNAIAKMLSNDPEKGKNYLDDTLIHFQAMSFSIVKEGLLSRSLVWQSIIRKDSFGIADVGRYLSRSVEFLVLYVSAFFIPQDYEAATLAAASPDSGYEYPEAPMTSLARGLPLGRAYKAEIGGGKSFGLAVSLTPSTDLMAMNSYLTTDPDMRSIVIPLLGGPDNTGKVVVSSAAFLHARNSEGAEAAATHKP
jgi:SAM-dependent MidA family methyltransferase